MEKVGYGIYLSERSKELLEDGTIDKLFGAVEEDLKGEWLATPPEAHDKREQAYFELHALSRVRLRISILVNDLLFRKDD